MMLTEKIMQSLTMHPEQTNRLLDDYIVFCRDTDNVQAGYDLAYDMQMLGFVDSALYLVEQLYQWQPIEIFLLLKAELLIDNQQVDDAIDILLTIPNDSDVYVSSLLILADAYQQLDLHEVALQKLQLAKRLLPDEPVIDLAQFEHYFYIGEYHKALAIIETLQYSDILSEEQYIKKISRVLVALGEYEEAVASLEQLKNDEHDSSSLFELGLAYYQIEDYQRAYHWLQDLVSKDPDFYSSYYYLGQAALNLHKTDEGISYLEQAIAYNPYHETLYLTLFEQYDKAYEHEKLTQLIEDAKVHGIDGLSWHIRLTRYYLRHEDYEMVIAYIHHILTIEDEESELYWILALAYAHLEEDEQAKVWFQKSYVLFKEDSEFLENYAQYAREIGDRQLYRTLTSKRQKLDEYILEEVEDDF